MTYEIDLSPEDKAAVRALALRHGISVEELLVRAIDRRDQSMSIANAVILATPESQ